MIDRLRDDRATQILEAWKTTVDVQMHFNDIGMRIRSIFVSIVLALFAAIGFLQEKKLSLDFLGIKVFFYTLLPLFGILAAYLFYFIDRYWYHRLLVGSVKHGILIEKRYSKQLPELALSDAIGKESPYAPTGFTRLIAKLIVRDPRFRNQGKLHSDGKIEFFYKTMMLVLAVLSILLAATGGVTIDAGTQNKISKFISHLGTTIAPGCSCHLCAC